MAIKKSELYSSLWAGCDELRGSMDASQYKDYVLVLLFMKYVSDKGGKLVDIPPGGSFQDMVKLKGDPEIGDKINKIIGELARANDLTGVITVADFNDDEKLGKGKEKVDRLSNLIAIFEKPALNFKGNRVEGDDLLGDAYEYLMRNFATQSGKSKGQFYTPAEVSRIMAKVISINQSTSQSDTLYDPTCGSGSLLLKAAAEAPHGISIYGQENDNATRALAVMNMWLHGNPTCDIFQGNTLANPQFTDDLTGELKQFDYAVANPPFSYKAWTNGWDPANDVYKRFDGYDAQPPQKNGDFAFLLHLIKSLKANGKGCIVLPLGVLFRGNTEAIIRKKLVQKGYIKGIIGLPPNLFYGTGIAACLIVIDKENAENRKEIFMIDASKGFMKDGNKNRLREQDIHKIVDAFNNRLEIPRYARRIPVAEIADSKNDYNLNIPRYINSQEPEDVQDIGAHLSGGIPAGDIEALARYWAVYPALKQQLFRPVEQRPGYYWLTIAPQEIKTVIFHHPEFRAFSQQMEAVFAHWKSESAAYLKALDAGLHPKQVIHTLSENLLRAYRSKPLLDKYDVYQHLMDYWADIMQDDLYELAVDGWTAGNEIKRLTRKIKQGKQEVEKEVPGLEGLEGTLISPALLIREYFAQEQQAIDALQAQVETLNAEMEELREEHGGEEGLLSSAMDDKGRISKGNLLKALKELAPLPGGRGAGGEGDNAEEYELLHRYKTLLDEEARLKTEIKNAMTALETLIIKQYPALSLAEIKTLVVEKKWMAGIEQRVRSELDNISQRLTQRIKELAERYAAPLPQLHQDVNTLSARVNEHLQRMGYL
ncbi:type I RM system M subunit [Candidatus Vecturithrix granuli]|uniref:site-specific DNA-methyltransferase (adenine-specific) n=1 Tax=Vecturithrix granuli TaxID=1499967 RepID=A0A081C8M6_VECG1|nr:type I RM system M subunit [Candidatus Vecturithrix granuli]